MAYTSFYSPINWRNKAEGTTTPLDKINLNKMDSAIETLDIRTVELDVKKAEQATVLDMVSGWTMDEKTGVITVSKLNGEQIMFDLNVEKIPVSFSMSEDGVITMITDDGTEYTADIKKMIPMLTFNSSDTIYVVTTGEGKNKTYSFEIKDGSVTAEKLQPNFLADVKAEVERAASSVAAARANAVAAESYTHGGTGTRESEDTDNAEYYNEQAKESAEAAASAVAGVAPVNNLLATVPGSPLDATQGRILDEKIKTIIFSDEEPTEVPANTIVMVYEV